MTAFGVALRAGPMTVRGVPYVSRAFPQHFTGCASDTHFEKLLRNPKNSTCFCRLGDSIKGVKLQVL